MTRAQLTEHIFSKGSYLCVGLDTDPQRMPADLPRDANGVLAFNKAVIDATLDHCVAYKINTAFYEALGYRGWEVMEQTVAHIPDTHFRIADAKRGDIGNTSSQYARAFLQTLPFDAVTIAPYMGEDSVRPFLQFEGKWGIVLGLTSNPGAADFELQSLDSEGNPMLYEEVIRTVAGWGTTENLMFVVGATQTTQFDTIRRIIPEHFLLVPGVGAQGGSLKEISQKALTPEGGLLVNVSRDVIYASSGNNFADAAGLRAQAYHTEMSGLLLPRLRDIGRAPI
ncbi:MAG: orotidine-5'-phosphate decarboxylase [Bacteroidetes bacterium]|nr:orotidine-5'-phosphate decarboxylase [Bacteroidota bacterium]